MKNKNHANTRKKPAFIVVHPDDESFLAAGKIWKNFKAGGQSFVLCESF